MIAAAIVGLCWSLLWPLEPLRVSSPRVCLSFHVACSVDATQGESQERYGAA